MRILLTVTSSALFFREVDCSGPKGESTPTYSLGSDGIDIDKGDCYLGLVLLVDAIETFNGAVVDPCVDMTEVMVWPLPPGWTMDKIKGGFKRDPPRRVSGYLRTLHCSYDGVEYARYHRTALPDTPNPGELQRICLAVAYQWNTVKNLVFEKETAARQAEGQTVLDCLIAGGKPFPRCVKEAFTSLVRESGRPPLLLTVSNCFESKSQQQTGKALATVETIADCLKPMKKLKKLGIEPSPNVELAICVGKSFLGEVLGLSTVLKKDETQPVYSKCLNDLFSEPV